MTGKLRYFFLRFVPRRLMVVLKSINFGWSGLLVEADQKKVTEAGRYYRQTMGSRAGNVRMSHAHVTAANIDAPLYGYNFQGDIDLLSIDIDGNDFWIWQAIRAICPRVVVGVGVLPCPGTEKASGGFVIRLNHPDLENRTENEPALWTAPDSDPDGWMRLTTAK